MIPQKRDPIAQLVGEVKMFAESCAESAKMLRKEVENGRCFRQAPECKLARIQVLECHRDWARRVLRIKLPSATVPGENAKLEEPCGSVAVCR